MFIVVIRNSFVYNRKKNDTQWIILMKLQTEQKKALILWISEDLDIEQINDKSMAFDPPFNVSEGQFKYYRRSNKEEIIELQEINGKDLSPRQLFFCEFYLETSNGTLSSKLAEYAPGASDNVHAANASRLLRTVKIKKYLSKRYTEAAMPANEVLARLGKLARASISDYINEHGVIDWKKVQKDGYAISKVTHIKGQQSRIEIESRKSTLELIGKAHAMFTMKIAPVDPTGTKEYAADARTAILGKLIPELAGEDEGS